MQQTVEIVAYPSHVQLHSVTCFRGGDRENVAGRAQAHAVRGEHANAVALVRTHVNQGDLSQGGSYVVFHGGRVPGLCEARKHSGRPRAWR